MAIGFRDLTDYKKAFDLDMKVFEIMKKLPSREKYELTDQKLPTALCQLPIPG